MKLQIGFVVALAFGTWLPAAAQPLLDIDPHTDIGTPPAEGQIEGSVGPTTTTADIGYLFALTDSVSVSALGWFDWQRDGLNQARQVRIWIDDGPYLTDPIIDVTVPGGTQAQLEGAWRTVPVDLVLEPNRYAIAGRRTGPLFEEITDWAALFIEPQLHPTRIHSAVERMIPATRAADPDKQIIADFRQLMDDGKVGINDEGLFIDPESGFDCNGDGMTDITDTGCVSDFSFSQLLVQGAFLGPNLFLKHEPNSDCDGDGVVGARDLACITSIGQRDTVLAALNSQAGDLNGDGDVDFDDFLLLLEHFGQATATYGEGNIDLVNGVDFDDFVILSNNFGFSNSASVPEATAAVLILLGLGGIITQIRTGRKTEGRRNIAGTTEAGS